MHEPALTFLRCEIVRRDLVFISAQDTALNARGIDHTRVLRWKAGAFAHFTIDWATTALCATPSPLTLRSMGLDGDVHVFQGNERWVERIDGPDRIGPLRDMRLIAGAHYAVGMQRQVYRREAPGPWRAMTDALAPGAGIKSFEAIDGFSADELYAVGMDGELWLFDGARWQALDSPTDATLHRVHCSDDGLAYIVGQGGVAFVGRRRQWRPLEVGPLDDDLWGVQTFRGHVYLASSRAVYRAIDGQARAVELGATGLGAARFLTSGDGVLWSVGSRHLAYTDDGARWTVVDGAAP